MSLPRLHEPVAYGPEPRADCWWGVGQAEAPPPLCGEVEADVAIIGAGVTGLNAAHRLAKAGQSVVMLDAQRPGWGASGRNGGFCCLGGTRHDGATLTRRFGAEAAREMAEAETLAVGYVEQVIEDAGLEVERHSQGETVLAHGRRSAQALQAAAAAGWGRYLSAAELRAEGQAGPSFRAGLHVPAGFALNPQRYTDGLARCASGAGAVLYGQSEVTQIKRAPEGGWRLMTAAGAVTAPRFIVATNGYSAESVPPWIAARTMPMQSSVIVTRPISAAEQKAQGWTSAQMSYDTRNLLHYFRLMPDGRFLFGMRGGLTARPREEAAIRRRIRRDFEAMFPAWAHVETDHYWSGLLCMTRSGLPFAGPIPGMEGGFAAFGYHGNGVAMGSYCGALLAQRLLGEGETLPGYALFARPPARFPLGRARRLFLRPAYWALAVQDRLG